LQWRDICGIRMRESDIQCLGFAREVICLVDHASTRVGLPPRDISTADSNPTRQ
jgi:hypothetical protein